VDQAAFIFAVNYSEDNKKTEEFIEKFVGPIKAYELCLEYIKEKLAIFLSWRKKYGTPYFLYLYEHELILNHINKAADYSFQRENKLYFMNINMLLIQNKEDNEQKLPAQTQNANDINRSLSAPASPTVNH